MSSASRDSLMRAAYGRQLLRHSRINGFDSRSPLHFNNTPPDGHCGRGSSKPAWRPFDSGRACHSPADWNGRGPPKLANCRFNSDRGNQLPPARVRREKAAAVTVASALSLLRDYAALVPVMTLELRAWAAERQTHPSQKRQHSLGSFGSQRAHQHAPMAKQETRSVESAVLRVTGANPVRGTMHARRRALGG
jgi:hypothetical protein